MERESSLFQREVNLQALREILEERFCAQDYQEAQELVVGACQEAQRLYGWVSPEAAQLIADHFGVTINRVYGLLTFYADFRTEPPGRHFLWLCNGAACYVAGGHQLLDVLEKEFRVSDHQTNPDGTFTLHVFNGCLGVCDLAPVVQLNHRRYLGRLTAERLRLLLEELRDADSLGGTHAEAH